MYVEPQLMNLWCNFQSRRNKTFKIVQGIEREREREHYFNFSWLLLCNIHNPILNTYRLSRSFSNKSTNSVFAEFMCFDRIKSNVYFLRTKYIPRMHIDGLLFKICRNSNISSSKCHTDFPDNHHTVRTSDLQAQFVCDALRLRLRRRHFLGNVAWTSNGSSSAATDTAANVHCAPFHPFP